MTIYSPITFINDSAPPINASALNHIQDGIVAAHTEIASQAVLLASSIGYASDLAGNIGAQGSAIAAQASTIYGQGQAVASLAAADVALASGFAAVSAVVGSQSAALASALPLVEALASAAGPQASTLVAHGSALASHGLVLDGLATSLGAQGSSIVALGSTVSEFTGLAAVASAFPAVQAQATQVGAILAGGPYSRGRGPLDLYLLDSNAPILAGPGALAVGQRVVPDQDWVVSQFSLDITDNSPIPTAPGQFSFGILNSVGTVIARSTPTTVPSVLSGQSMTVVVPATATTTLLAGQPYHILVASDDEFKFNPFIKYAIGADALRRRGLAHQWPLPSGINLASYGSFPLNLASSVSPVNGLPAPFVS